MSIKIFPTYVKLLNKYVNQNCKVKGYLTCDINYNLFQNYIYICMYYWFLLPFSWRAQLILVKSSAVVQCCLIIQRGRLYYWLGDTGSQESWVLCDQMSLPGMGKQKSLPGHDCAPGRFTSSFSLIFNFLFWHCLYCIHQLFITVMCNYQQSSTLIRYVLVILWSILLLFLGY